MCSILHTQTIEFWGKFSSLWNWHAFSSLKRMACLWRWVTKTIQKEEEEVKMSQVPKIGFRFMSGLGRVYRVWIRFGSSSSFMLFKMSWMSENSISMLRWPSRMVLIIFNHEMTWKWQTWAYIAKERIKKNFFQPIFRVEWGRLAKLSLRGGTGRRRPMQFNGCVLDIDRFTFGGFFHRPLHCCKKSRFSSLLSPPILLD